MFKHLSDERRLDAVEQIIPLAEKAGLPMTHLAMAFAIAHPGVTSAIIGPRTMEQLDDLLAGVDVTLTDEILDRIDEIVPPGHAGKTVTVETGGTMPGNHRPAPRPVRRLGWRSRYQYDCYLISALPSGGGPDGYRDCSRRRPGPA